VARDGGSEDRGHRARARRGAVDLKYSAGTLPHEAMMRSIELYGREVIPRVRRLLAEGTAALAEDRIAAPSR
jgi:hypothetical protein